AGDRLGTGQVRQPRRHKHHGPELKHIPEIQDPHAIEQQQNAQAEKDHAPYGAAGTLVVIAAIPPPLAPIPHGRLAIFRPGVNSSATPRPMTPAGHSLKIAPAREAFHSPNRAAIPRSTNAPPTISPEFIRSLDFAGIFSCS